MATIKKYNFDHELVCCAFCFKVDFHSQSEVLVHYINHIIENEIEDLTGIGSRGDGTIQEEINYKINVITTLNDFTNTVQLKYKSSWLYNFLPTIQNESLVDKENDFCQLCCSFFARNRVRRPLTDDHVEHLRIHHRYFNFKCALGCMVTFPYPSELARDHLNRTHGTNESRDYVVKLFEIRAIESLLRRQAE